MSKRSRMSGADGTGTACRTCSTWLSSGEEFYHNCPAFGASSSSSSRACPLPGAGGGNQRNVTARFEDAPPSLPRPHQPPLPDPAPPVDEQADEPPMASGPLEVLPPREAPAFSFLAHHEQIRTALKRSPEDMSFMALVCGKRLCSKNEIQDMLVWEHEAHPNSPVTFKHAQQVLDAKDALIKADGWQSCDMTTEYFGEEPLMLYWRCPLTVIINQWKRGLSKGVGFLQTPAEVVVNGERRYTHPMTCNWAIKLQELIQKVTAIKAHAADCGLDLSPLLAFSLFSDATLVGNLSAYPMQISQMHSVYKDIHTIFAEGHGVCAYIPVVADKPTGSSGFAKKQHTERMTDLLARCLNKILASLKAASHLGTEVWHNGRHFHLVPALLSYLHDNPEGRDVACVWTSPRAAQICCLCFIDRRVCGQIPLTAPKLKHFFILNNARRLMKAVLEVYPGGEHAKNFDANPGAKGKAMALKIAKEHGVRDVCSGLDGFGLQPLGLLDPYLFNSILQAMFPDVMHVFPGGVWKKLLEWLFLGVKNVSKIKEELTIRLEQIKAIVPDKVLPLPSHTYFEETGKITNNEHKAVMQVSMILFHNVGLEDRIPLLRATIELYMQLTNRNMERYHTDISIASLQSKHAQWKLECTKLLDSLHQMEEFKGKKFSETTDENLPKFHDVWHLCWGVSERGPVLYHSTEGPEAGHKFLAKQPGRRIDQKQRNMNKQLTGCVRFRIQMDGMARELAELEARAAAAKAVCNSEEDQTAQRACARLRAKITGNIEFLASAETLRLRSGQLSGRVPSSPDSHLHKLMCDEECKADLLSIPSKLAQMQNRPFYENEELTITVSSRAYLMGERTIGQPRPVPQLMCLSATPLFHRKRRFTSVLYRHQTGSVALYQFAEVRVLFSIPPSSSAANTTARVNSGAEVDVNANKFALVQCYNRYFPSLSPIPTPRERQARNVEIGMGLLSPAPTEAELGLGTGCMKLRRLSKLATLVIPLSWIVQGVMVIPELGTAAKDRNSELCFLNRWYWGTNGEDPADD